MSYDILGTYNTYIRYIEYTYNTYIRYIEYIK